MEACTIGLDLAKRVFQVHGVDATGKVVFRTQLRRSQVVDFFEEAATVSRGHGGLRNGASLGTRAQDAWSRRSD